MHKIRHILIIAIITNYKYTRIFSNLLTPHNEAKNAAGDTQFKEVVSLVKTVYPKENSDLESVI